MRITPLQKLRHLLKKAQLDAVFISAIPSITYLTNFSGFENEDRNAFALITKKNQYIFTHGIYKEAAQNFIKNFTLIDIAREQPISASLQKLLKKHGIKKMGFEAYDITYSEYTSLAKKIPSQILVAADEIIQDLRIHKTADEIAAIKRACQLGDKAFTFLLSKIAEGITEKELAFEYEFFIKKEGASISFDTIVAFGANGSLPHHIPTTKKLTKNNFIVLDFGVKLDNYCSDMTRTIFFGKASKEQKRMYTTVLTAQIKAIELLSKVPSPKAAVVDKIARDYIVSQGYPDMPHSLGHGIGLLVHEQPRLSPSSKDVLTEGMVFSVEPGMYIPNLGGVRIEDLVTLRSNSVELLTNAPKHLIELSKNI